MVSDSQTRPTLLERIQDGRDDQAWQDFFGRYWRLIYALARHRGCSEQTAEEIVQEVMVAVFQQRDVFRYDPGRGRFRDWLAALVRNKVADRRREPGGRVRAAGGENAAGAAHVRSAEPGPDEAWETVFEEALLATLLDCVRKEVNPRTFQAFELFTLHQMSGAEVAEATGLTRNAVYQARKHVIQRLVQLGASYRHEGQLDQRIQRAMARCPSPAVERSLTQRVTQRMQSR